MNIQMYACPCCGFKTFVEKPNGNFDICEVCFWEDDPIQLENPDFVGGANKISLRQGQRNYLEFGACEKEMIKNVRKPSEDEQRDENWKPFDNK